MWAFGVHISGPHGSDGATVEPEPTIQMDLKWKAWAFAAAAYMNLGLRGTTATYAIIKAKTCDDYYEREHDKIRCLIWALCTLNKLRKHSQIWQLLFVFFLFLLFFYVGCPGVLSRATKITVIFVLLVMLIPKIIRIQNDHGCKWSAHPRKSVSHSWSNTLWRTWSLSHQQHYEHGSTRVPLPGKGSLPLLMFVILII